VSVALPDALRCDSDEDGIKGKTNRLFLAFCVPCQRHFFVTSPHISTSAAHAMNATAADISPGLAAARAMLGVDTVSAHPAAVVLFDLLLLPRWWSGPWALFGLTVATMFGLEILSWSVPLTLEHYASKLVRIEPGGRLLHRLVAIDHIYIWWNKFVTACFVIHYLQWMLHGGPQHVVVELSFASMTWTNMIAPLILSFLVYDAMYAPFHRFLHWQPIYPYIHKHHHRHLAPHRGLDGIVVISTCSSV
jgi:hypothetical protein